MFRRNLSVFIFLLFLSVGALCVPALADSARVDAYAEDKIYRDPHLTSFEMESPGYRCVQTVRLLPLLQSLEEGEAVRAFETSNSAGGKFYFLMLLANSSRRLLEAKRYVAGDAWTNTVTMTSRDLHEGLVSKRAGYIASRVLRIFGSGVAAGAIATAISGSYFELPWDLAAVPGIAMGSGVTLNFLQSLPYYPPFPRFVLDFAGLRRDLALETQVASAFAGSKMPNRFILLSGLAQQISPGPDAIADELLRMSFKEVELIEGWQSYVRFPSRVRSLGNAGRSAGGPAALPHQN